MHMQMGNAKNFLLCFFLSILGLNGETVSPSLAAVGPHPHPQAEATPAFTDTGREQRVKELLPEIDELYRDFAADGHVPGLVYGVVFDGRLIHSGATGFANVEMKLPAAADVRFRIASMSKSFTAMAVLKLRDEGKLSLDDPVERYVPELAKVTPATSDSPPIRIRHLLTMTAGFPEDNPWGDRQLADSVEELKSLVRGGLSLSDAPGINYEYSNLGYALLGQIVSQVSGLSYQQYITREILLPLGMKNTCWEFAEVPADKLALGYRRENEGWKIEPLLHDGTYGAMGGLLTTLEDFGRYVSFHLSAWPARSEPDNGPVKRATLREMHKPSEVIGLAAGTGARARDEQRAPTVSGYGYGLNWSLNGRNVVSVGHSGGLPGFGSNYRFCPDYGVGVIAFTNLTYTSAGATNLKALNILLDKGKLPPRTLPVSDILETRKQQVAELISSWDQKLCDEVLAENFFPDRSRDAWVKSSRDLLDKTGRILSVGPLVPQNRLRGTFDLQGERGLIHVFFTLTPEKPPKVQQLMLRFGAKAGP